MFDQTTATKSIKQWLGRGSIDLFGVPFAGKDTQGQRLAVMLDAPMLSTGEILRGSVLPPKVQASMSKGELIPSADLLGIFLPYLSRPEFKSQPLILSSVGKKLGEETIIMQAAKETGHPIKAAIYLKITEEEVWQRWQSRSESQSTRDERNDDDKKSLHLRLTEFKEKTLPVIESYRKLGLLVEVDGSPEPDQVTQAILKVLLQKVVN